MKNKSVYILLLLIIIVSYNYKAIATDPKLFKYKVTYIDGKKNNSMPRPDKFFFKDSLNGMAIVKSYPLCVFITTDGGLNWKEAFTDNNIFYYHNPIKVNDSVYFVTVYPSVPDSIIPSQDFGYYWKTTDVGLTWDTIHIGDPNNKLTIWDIDCDSTGFYTALATSKAWILEPSCQYYYNISNDYGKTWSQPKLFPIFDTTITNKVSSIYAPGGKNIYALNNFNDFKQQFLFSSDGGESWSVKHLPGYVMRILKCIFFSPDKYYVLSLDTLSQDTVINGKPTLKYHNIGYIHYTTDGGNSWTEIFSHEPSGFFNGGYAFTPQGNEFFVMKDDKSILIFGDLYLYRSLDGGKTWYDDYIDNPDKSIVNFLPTGGLTFITDNKYIVGGLESNGCYGDICIVEDFLPNPCATDTFNFPDFSSTKNLTFVNDAEPYNNVVRLTPSIVEKVGAVWYKDPVPVNCDFTVNFSFQFKNGYSSPASGDTMPGGDGIAFVIQYDNNNACGNNGGGIGYDGIPNSLAVEYDAFKNDSTQVINLNDPNDSHIAVQTKGRLPNSSRHDSTNTLGTTKKRMPIKSDGTIYYSRIDYKKEINELDIYLNNSSPNLGLPVLKIKNLNLDSTLYLHDSSCAYIGFTGATGTAYQTQNILSWSYTNNLNQTSSVDALQQVQSTDIVSYPNPATQTTIIRFDLEQSANVSLRLTDMLGNQITLIENQYMDSGSHSVDWDASCVSAGVYYYVLQIGRDTLQCVRSGKVVVVR